MKKTDYRVGGRTFCPDGTQKVHLEKARPAKGFGRWIHCKYCCKNVRPMLSGINQIICSECGSGLTPDFQRIDNLKRWLSGDKSAARDDIDLKEENNEDGGEEE